MTFNWGQRVFLQSFSSIWKIGINSLKEVRIFLIRDLFEDLEGALQPGQGRPHGSACLASAILLTNKVLERGYLDGAR